MFPDPYADNTIDASQVDLTDPEVFLGDIHVVATLLKQYFESLPEPLLTPAVTSRFADAIAISDSMEQRTVMQKVINELSQAHQVTLKALTLHLKRIAAKNSQNAMTRKDLAAVFTSVVMGRQQYSPADAVSRHRVMEAILEDMHQIFGDVEER